MKFLKQRNRLKQNALLTVELYSCHLLSKRFMTKIFTFTTTFIREF